MGAGGAELNKDRGDRPHFAEMIYVVELVICSLGLCIWLPYIFAIILSWKQVSN